MSTLELSPENALYYEYTAPTKAGKPVFVFFNALTGDAGMWKTGVGVTLLEQGFGILVYNMRGQANSPYAANLKLDQNLIVADAISLLKEVSPAKPIFVGLSIGGLFAAGAALKGAECAGMVFLNTLRRDGPRLKWINDAVVRLAEVGGPDLLRDVLSPLIMNEQWQSENRVNCFTDEEYTPIDHNSGAYNLLSSARSSDWDVDYESLTMPTLVVTGKHDRIFRDLDDIAQLAGRLPNSTRVDFDDAGHMIPIEQTQKLADLLADFGNKLV